MKYNYKHLIRVIVPIICLCSVLVFNNIGSYCASGGRGGLIYDSNSRNAQIIREFNNMSDSEKQKLIGTVFPIITKKLGYIYSDAYTVCNDRYKFLQLVKKGLFNSAEDYYLNSTDDQFYKDMYVGVTLGSPTYYWYSDLAEYLSQKLVISEDDNLYVNDTEPIYYIIDDVINEEITDNGFVYGEMYSYMNINTDQFNNVGLYGDFIRLCKEHNNLGVGYVFVMKDSSTSKIVYVMFADKKPNIYNNGTTITNSSLQLCDSMGNYTFTFDVYRQLNASATHFDKINESSKLRNLRLGSSVVPSGNVFGITNGYKDDGFGIYSLNPNKAKYYFSTSLNGWINTQGHYEPTYQLEPYYGNVPTVTVSPNNMTTYYIQNYTDNSSGDTIYYPPNYNDDDVGFDDNNKTVKFNGVVDFLESIGALIGSLINGIASGLANIVNSLASIVNNLRNNLMQGVIFEFLKTFIGWLPVEIVSLLTALFAVTVLFALIKLLKGFF